MKAGLFCLVGACAMLSTARADIDFTDRNAFGAAVSGLGPILENWGELPNGTVLTTYNGITYTPGTAGDQAVTTNSYFCNGCTEGLGATMLGYFGLSESITFTFSVPTDIFGIDINTNAITPDYTLTTNAGSIALSGYDPFPGYLTGEFIGLIATTPFTSATITPAGGFFDNYTLDNLTYNAYNATPEPGSLPLLAIVILGGLAFVWKGRRGKGIGSTGCAVLFGLSLLIGGSPHLLAQAPPAPPGPHSAPPPQNFCGDTVTVVGPVTVDWPKVESADEGEEVPEGQLCPGAPTAAARVGSTPRVSSRPRVGSKPKAGIHPDTQAADPILLIPNWSYTVTSSRDGNNYAGTMVGGAPLPIDFIGGGTTTVDVIFLPVIWRFHTQSGTYVFDPTQPDSACGQNVSPLARALNSPLYQPQNWTWGGTLVGANTTFPDAFQRAEFWGIDGVNPNYHLQLAVSVPYELIIDAYSGFYVGYTNCGFAGVVDFASFDNFFQTVIDPLIAGIDVSPSNFPFLMFYNVFLQTPLNPKPTLDGGYILGYHNVFTPPIDVIGFQVPGFFYQTYGVAAYNSTNAFGDSTDVATMTHETMEWINDPLTNNPTPAWGHIGQQSGCQNNLEVGDPLSGTNMPAITKGGFTYHLQELAFFSWFYGAPSAGVNGWYSSNDTFKSSAGPVCTEGNNLQ